MHITRFTDLSLRVLMYLCARPSQDRTTVTEIAERIGWTRNHVVKVCLLYTSPSPRDS